MDNKNLKGIIELGNLTTKCLIFNINIDNEYEILSTSIASTEGIHNGNIVNLTKASNTIRSCISAAEKKANVSLKKINIVIEQPEFLCTKFSKHKKINGSKIHKDDVEFLLREAKKQLIYNDEKQSIIHIFNHNYVVDGKLFIEEPIGVYADSLSHEITFITMSKNSLRNINQAFMDCDIEIERIISRTFALAVELLDNKKLDDGSILVDLESERTGVGLFKNLALVHSATLPVGVSHIMKDISKVCSLNLEESRNIKDNFDYSFINNHKFFDQDNYLKKSYFITSNFRKISKNLILSVVEARLDEIFNYIKKQIVVPGFDPISGKNILLTGYGSTLHNIEKYCANFFGLNVHKTEMNDSKITQDLEKDFTPSLGALKIIKDGWETEAIPEINRKNVEKISFLRKIFGSFL